MNQLKLTLPDFLNNIRIVLTRINHPANIGPAAHAMKTMGLSDLVLIALNPISTPMMVVPPVFDPQNSQNFKLPEESFTPASGTIDVLHNACVTAMLGGAPADTTISCALTSHRRGIVAPLQTPRELIPELLQAAQCGEKVTLVFGNGTFGLSIEEVWACNRLMTINGNPDYFSLSLVQAVQAVCYEIFSQTDMPMTHLQQEGHAATHEQIKDMIAYMGNATDDIGFFSRRGGKRLMYRMQSLSGRANTQAEDINILRGFFSTASHHVSKKN